MDAHQTHVFVETLGWTLIHFLWQGALVAALLWLVLGALADSTSRVRYLVRCAALAGMTVAPAVTFVWLWGEAPPLPSLGSAESIAALSSVDAPTTTETSGLAWIVGLWTLGAFACMLRISGGLVQVSRLRRRAQGEALAPRWQRRFDQLARDFGVRARARLVESAQVCVPAVIGFARPIVLLPARLFSGLSDEQIEALLAHELAHIARNDYLVNIVQSVVESLLFYHPAVWWVSRGIRVEREYCCDDLAVAATHNGLAYAHALTAIESWRGAQPQLGVSTLGGSLMLRIQRLLGVTPTSTRKTLRPAHAIAGLFVAGTLTASAFAVATLPEPALCDCKCACHRESAKQQNGNQWRYSGQLPSDQAQETETGDLVLRGRLFMDKTSASGEDTLLEGRVVRARKGASGDQAWLTLHTPEVDATETPAQGWRLLLDGTKSNLKLQRNAPFELAAGSTLVLRNVETEGQANLETARVVRGHLVLDRYAPDDCITDAKNIQQQHRARDLEKLQGYLLEVRSEVDEDSGLLELRALLSDVEERSEDSKMELEHRYLVQLEGDLLARLPSDQQHRTKEVRTFRGRISNDNDRRNYELGLLTRDLRLAEDAGAKRYYLNRTDTAEELHTKEIDLTEVRVSLELELDALRRRLDEVQQELDQRTAQKKKLEWKLKQRE